MEWGSAGGPLVQCFWRALGDMLLAFLEDIIFSLLMFLKHEAVKADC